MHSEVESYDQDSRVTVSDLEAARPVTGLFADKDWLYSPSPFLISPKWAKQLERLGHQLLVFQAACNDLYYLSVKGKQPSWIAEYLDAGKPPELIEYSRSKFLRMEVPRVIRPDILLTPEGMALSELDSVPGGIGLAGWLGETYSQFGYDILGGPHGMLQGFQTIHPGGQILVSDEAGTYRPEMAWVANRLNEQNPQTKWSVENPDEISSFTPEVYRFFELFDLPNISSISSLLKAEQEGNVHITPPIKPFMEEKMWFGLFWLRPLREYWRRALGSRYFSDLQKVIPYTWILDPTPLPHHGVIPELNIQRWEELEEFSQKERQFILKVSGFSELAWGSRSVVVGHDVPAPDWKQNLQKAFEDFSHGPWILQKFHNTAIFSHPYFDTDNHVVQMDGRIRFCPYYFVDGKKAHLSGALVTICPADKKIIHGMKDAILVPAAVKI